MWVGLMVMLLGMAEPQVKWVYEARSQLYAAPLVADLNPAPGLEAVISDSEARRLRCIGSDGKQIWEYDGGWKKRLTSAAALSRTAQPGKATLAVGNGDGSVDCVDGESGTRLWKSPVGKVEWSNVVWADLNGDGRDELVVASEDTGLTALDSDGGALWKFAGSVTTVIAATDVDADGKCEVFACMKWGPLCVNPDGSLRWRAATGDDFSNGAVVLAQAKRGDWMVYSTSRDAAALQCFDAKTGQRRWVAPMIAPCDIYSASSVAVGNLDADDSPDVVLADRAGRIYCFDAQLGRLALDVRNECADPRGAFAGRRGWRRAVGGIGRQRRSWALLSEP